MNKNLIALAAIGALVIGGGYIIYSGRPVIKMEKELEAEVESEEVSDRVDDKINRSANEETEIDAVVQTPSIAVGEPNPSAPSSDSKVIQNLPNETAPSESGPKAYSMADVQAHATAESCWATINGSVYDLTTWIARHPGGPDKIIGLCGTDGSEKFNRKHGTFVKAQDMLVLLKIGVLK